MRLHLECLDAPRPDQEYQPEWIQVEDEKYLGERIPVDNYQYGNCRFENCTFVYSGGPFAFFDCVVEGGCYLALTGAAQRSIEFWQQFREHLRKTTPPY